MKKILVVTAFSLLSVACAPFTGKLGQHQAVAVLMPCDPQQNGGHISEPKAGQTCEQKAAENYQQYVNDMKSVEKSQ